MTRVLVIEDERKVALALEQGLRQEHFDVAVAMDGEDGFFRLSTEQFDVVVLDVMLPGRDGIAILSTIRDHGNQTPVLILTARDAVEDRVFGLDRGADDYLVKPFAFDELVARVRALLRRGRSGEALRLKAADLQMDLVTRTVRRADTLIDLTAREFELLEYLLRNQGHAVSRQTLAREVWRVTSRVTPIDNVIDVHISRLRKKIDDDFDAKLILTVRGVGFMVKDGTP